MDGGTGEKKIPSHAALPLTQTLTVFYGYTCASLRLTVERLTVGC
jgi:hypothetical protein